MSDQNINFVDSQIQTNCMSHIAAHFTKFTMKCISVPTPFQDIGKLRSVHEKQNEI